VVAALEEDARVRLQDVFVEVVADAPVDAVGAEVVHEEREDGVGEEVLAGAVRGRGEPRSLQGVAEEDGVEVREVGGHVDGRAAAHELAELLEGAFDDDLVGDGLEAEELFGPGEELSGASRALTMGGRSRVES
jgi:hypothetical protein